ncbi:ethanolamine ammonia-lyase reactivating factor EutA [Desulforamulus ruminis]|nr:ethanolamine ammonia-lyase reactivating factor EutA [Desulforamulus ruminis]
MLSTAKQMEEMTSVGIDVGTTTTQMVVSRISVCNTAPGSMVPHMSITGKEILYRSEVYFTPLLTRERIDAQGVTEIIAREYQKAGLGPEQVDTGAVIITGETAKKENARSLSEALAGYAGNFVVATAGPLLESVLAGRGAGAAAMSSEFHRVVLNIDVGGGTSNLAVFREGRVIDATCVNIGGRLVELDPGGEFIQYLAPAAKIILEEGGQCWEVGKGLELEALKALTVNMARAIRNLLKPGLLPPVTSRILMGPSLRLDYPIHYVTFSGGVADFIYSGKEIRNVQECSRFGDIGPLLGRAIKENFDHESWQLVRPRETLRATVIGAGSHTMNLSGSTIDIAPERLPMRNIPVIKPFPDEVPLSQVEMSQGLAGQLWPYRSEGFQEPVAIALKGLGRVGFKKIQEIAAVIIQVTKDYAKSQPLVLILEEDCAKVLGQSLRVLLTRKRCDVICLDQIRVEDGDYIDIGIPIMDGSTVPVVIKTLIFERDP